MNFLRALYHLLLAELAAAWYGHPSRRMTVVGVTGTNGKSTTVELIVKILEESGFKVASVSSVRFKIGDKEWPNTLKMTMPGRGALQKFLRDAKREHATHAVLEATSEGIHQSRHRAIAWDALVLTNVTPEHIESHGSFEKYRRAKEKLFKLLSKTYRKNEIPKVMVVNADDASRDRFLRYDADKKITYSAKEYEVAFEDGGMRILTPAGMEIRSKLTGAFNLANIAAATALARALNIGWDAIKRGIEKADVVAGRMEYIQHEPFAVIVDYAHTPDALHKVYEALQKSLRGSSSEILRGRTSLICVLGAAGGGRDKWKRPEFGKIASEFCSEVILTNEDPYDENPEAILNDIEAGLPAVAFFDPPKPCAKEVAKAGTKALKILDRGTAIERAIHDAKAGDVVIITGKGCEPWIMGPKGSKTAWDDREVARKALVEKQ
ncbi:MAG: UDP-N-acetylmuramyl-tripeptide synthetase [Candidatus Niyogibacteria bacterium]|nr:UDP-N-acetylmuramyl-tripeptide synthetase [Candidatus Niyogibacteria bacterium]